MKRSVLRIGCAVLSLSAAAGLLASCSLLPPASPLPDSKPAQAEEAPDPAAASLDDGKLRILYSNGSNGGNTVLCGNTVLYQAASSETVYLVPDTLTGTVRYYLRQWSAPGTPTGRATALCDRSGKEILTFDRAYDAVLTGSLRLRPCRSSPSDLFAAARAGRASPSMLGPSACPPFFPKAR